MCRNLILLFTFFMFFYWLGMNAQTNNQKGASNTKVLSKSQQASQSAVDINNVFAYGQPNGYLFNKSDTFKALFLVPKQSNKQTILASSIWIGGFDQQDDLHLAANTYYQDGRDMFYGPVMDTTKYQTLQDSVWNRTWKVSRSDILMHQQSYNDPGYQMPEVIKNWPAHGDTTRGMAYHLAPFTDVNNTGHYEPSQGDYPKIKGDQAVYFIGNDIKNPHTETGAKQLGIEIRGMLYGYRCLQDSALKNTVFANYQLINRSNKTYDSVKAGLWSDLDLGNYMDDYIQCDVNRNAYFIYNGDSIDEGPKGYGNNPPAQSVVHLNDSMSNFMIYTNDFSTNGNPEVAQDYYNYLSNTWKNGVHAQKGGDGFEEGTKDANYIFPGNTLPNDTSNWTEETANNQPGERRGLSSTGPSTLQPGDTLELSLAFVYGRGDTGRLSSIPVMKNRIDQIINKYPNQLNPCVQSPISNRPNLQSKRPKVSIYPNPVKENLYLKYEISQPSTVQLKLYNLVGQPVHKQEFQAHQNGQHQLKVNVGDLPTGYYFYKFTANGQSKSGKLLNLDE